VLITTYLSLSLLVVLQLLLLCLDCGKRLALFGALLPRRQVCARPEGPFVVVPLLAWPRGQSAMLRCAVFGDCIPFFFIPLTTVASEATGASALTCSDMFLGSRTRPAKEKLPGIDKSQPLGRIGRNPLRGFVWSPTLTGRHGIIRSDKIKPTTSMMGMSLFVARSYHRVVLPRCISALPKRCALFFLLCSTLSRTGFLQAN
jgi:hypothetical protein